MRGLLFLQVLTCLMLFMRLLLSQKNQLHEAIELEKLNPFQFTLTENVENFEGGNSTEIVYKTNTEFKFRISPFMQYWQVDKCPGDDIYSSQKHFAGFDDVYLSFEKWLKYLKEEITSTDKWTLVNQVVSSIDLFKNEDIVNEKFSAHEFNILNEKMNQLQKGLSDIGLTINEINVINQKLDNIYLLALDLGKFDWANLFIGTIVSIIIQLGLTPENTSLLWKLVKEIFKGELYLN